MSAPPPEDYRPDREPRMELTVVVDNDSWILPYAKDLVEDWSREGHKARLVRDWEEVPEGDAAFFLGCVSKAPDEILDRNDHNLVVHESDLPEGRGFAPVHWQILGGADEIPVVLFEAGSGLDAGPIYLRDKIQLEGHELNPEWRNLQGRKTQDLCRDFVRRYPDVEVMPQEGDPTEFPRRTPEDSELDPDQTLREQFPLLRIVDNERYPAFFEIDGHRYELRIEKADDADTDTSEENP